MLFADLLSLHLIICLIFFYSCGTNIHWQKRFPCTTNIYLLRLSLSSWSYRWHSNRKFTWWTVSDLCFRLHLLYLLLQLYAFLTTKNTKAIPHYYHKHSCQISLSHCYCCYCHHKQPGPTRCTLPHHWSIPLPLQASLPAWDQSHSTDCLPGLPSSLPCTGQGKPSSIPWPDI